MFWSAVRSATVTGIIRFCSRCVFPMVFIQLLSKRRNASVYHSPDEPVRFTTRKGVKQGGLLFLSVSPAGADSRHFASFGNSHSWRS